MTQLTAFHMLGRRFRPCSYCTSKRVAVACYASPLPRPRPFSFGETLGDEGWTRRALHNHE